MNMVKISNMHVWNSQKIMKVFIEFPFHKGIIVGLCVWEYFVYVDSNIECTKLLSVRNQQEL